MEQLFLNLSLTQNKALNQDGITALRSISLVQGQTYQANLSLFSGSSQVAPNVSGFQFSLNDPAGNNYVSINSINPNGGGYFFTLPLLSPALGLSSSYSGAISLYANGSSYSFAPFPVNVTPSNGNGYALNYVSSLNGLSQNVSLSGSGSISVTSNGNSIVLTSAPTGAFYPINNPNGFITSSALAPYATDLQLSGASDFLQGQLSNYYPNSNPSGFITSSSLAPYATVTQLTGESGVLNGKLASYYLASNPSGYITTSALAVYATYSQLTGLSGVLQAGGGGSPSGVAHTSGNETLSGVKTFANRAVFPSGASGTFFGDGSHLTGIAAGLPTLMQPICFVSDAHGNDSTAVIGDATHPYKTLSAAATAQGFVGAYYFFLCGDYGGNIPQFGNATYCLLGGGQINAIDVSNGTTLILNPAMTLNALYVTIGGATINANGARISALYGPGGANGDLITINDAICGGTWEDAGYDAGSTDPYGNPGPTVGGTFILNRCDLRNQTITVVGGAGAPGSNGADGSGSPGTSSEFQFNCPNGDAGDSWTSGAYVTFVLSEGTVTIWFNIDGQGNTLGASYTGTVLEVDINSGDGASNVSNDVATVLTNNPSLFANVNNGGNNVSWNDAGTGAGCSVTISASGFNDGDSNVVMNSDGTNPTPGNGTDGTDGSAGATGGFVTMSWCRREGTTTVYTNGGNGGTGGTGGVGVYGGSNGANGSNGSPGSAGGETDNFNV